MQLFMVLKDKFEISSDLSCLWGGHLIRKKNVFRMLEKKALFTAK